MSHTAPHQIRLQSQPRQPPVFQLFTKLSLDEKYPLLIHTQPQVALGQVYIPHVDNNGSVSPSPSTTRCSSSTLALGGDDTRKIFTTPPPGRDGMMTPLAVCKKREQLKTRQILMVSLHSYPYAAPFYPVNQSNWDDASQLHEEHSQQPSRPPPPPLEVTPYRSSERKWKKHFTDGLEAPDLEIMRFHARRLVYCNSEWDEDELLHLSRAFVWRASERGERLTGPLAIFASTVHQVFHVAPWMGTYEHFRSCLWYVVQETFVSCWHFERHRTSRQAVTYIKNPSPRYMEYVVSALSICSFIGNLFRYHFINRPSTVGCIRVLVHNLTTVEHITAIYNIVKHAGIPLWREALNLDAEVQQFRSILLDKSHPLKDYKTVFLQPIRGNAGVRSKVDAILRHVEDCRLAVLSERRAFST